jgi:transposase
MSPQTLLPDAKLLHLDCIVPSSGGLTLVVRATSRSAPCPDCGRSSERVHSHYTRILSDLPWNGMPVRWRLRVRKFFCDGPECPRVVFTERLPTVTASHARRTVRLGTALKLIGYALGGEAGARIALELGIRVSGDTLLRQLRQLPAVAGHTPRVLGVDDWAFRKGHHYGTILVDLERGCVADLLPDRRAETLAAWLRQHPGVEVISRDRGGAYADGARQGAPDAVQVADRWHLLGNLAEALEAVLFREQQALRQAAQDPTVPPAPTHLPPAPLPGTATPPPSLPPTRADQEKAAPRERRHHRYQEVRRLFAEGYSVRAIAQLTGICRHTVRRYLQAEAFPEIKKRAAQPGKVEAFRPYLEERWQAGCHNATQLWREIQAQGYTGARSVVAQYLSSWRKRLPQEERQTSGPKPRAVSPLSIPAPQAVVWWLLGRKEKLKEEQTRFVTRLCQDSAVIARARELVQEFFQLVRERRSADLEKWVEAAVQSEIAELKSFAAGLRRDWQAVVAALTLRWSNGPVEGHVHRLKLVKRQMYGRAGFALLRARVLPAS